MPIFFFVVLLSVFFAVSAFFSLAETAILAANRYKIRHLASQGNRRASRLIGWLEAPERLLATILLGNNFANVGAATASAALVGRIVRNPDRVEIALAIEAVILTVLILLFCELGPKALAARYPERISLAIVIPIELCMRLLYPATKVGIKISSLVFRQVKDAPGPLTPAVTDAELRSLIAGNRQERMKMLERVLEFSDRQVKDVMIPRLEVTALEAASPLEDILAVIESTRYSRFPVYQGVLDNVIGILHGKDLMPYLHSPKAFRLSQLLRKPVFIPDTARLNNAVRMLQSAQTHLGVVVDEHGGVEGIVTLEDLIEQIVGEIQDEHDVKVDSVVIDSDGSILIDASIAVRELNERLDLRIPETGQYQTLAGFLLAQTGKLLKEREEVSFEGAVFRIEQVVGRRIMRVRLSRKAPAPVLVGVNDTSV